MTKATYNTNFLMTDGTRVDVNGEWDSVDEVQDAINADIGNPFFAIKSHDGGRTILATDKIVLITIKKVG